MMLDRHKLHFGPYRTRRFKYFQHVECLARGDVKIVKLTDARIPWPIGRAQGAESLVLFRGLARAVRREANQAVAYWFGVSEPTVKKWRRKLGVPPCNEGSRRLMVAIGKSPIRDAALKAMQAKARDPVRRAKIAAAKRGKPRPPQVAKMLRTLRIGRRASKATRQKMSQAQKRRGAWPPAAGETWKAWEDKLVRKLSPAAAAARTGRTLSAVSQRRHTLRLPDGRRRALRRRGRLLPLQADRE